MIFLVQKVTLLLKIQAKLNLRKIREYINMYHF